MDITQSRQQLEQVEAALLTNPDDEHLKQLAADLREVIELQATLANATATQQGAMTASGEWSVGDICEAVWSQDGYYYKAEVLSFEAEGQKVKVRYVDYGEEDTVTLESLRHPGATAPATNPDTSAADGTTVTGATPVQDKKKTDKQLLKEKKLKKAKRRKEKEEELQKKLDEQKNSWQSFNKKAFKKKGPQKKKKSIFASPDDPNGKVGVGTCNIGGRGMTEFQEREKWQFTAAKK